MPSDSAWGSAVASLEGSVTGVGRVMYMLAMPSAAAGSGRVGANMSDAVAV